MADVLDAARSFFLQVGYRAATMEAIALRANVSKRTLYLWHEDKPALFRACVLDGAERFPLPALDSSRPLAEALECYARDIASSLAAGERQAMRVLLMREGRDFPELAPTIEQIEGRYMTWPLIDYFSRQGIEGPLPELAHLFIGMALSESNHRAMLGLPQPLPDATARHAALVTEVFLRGRAPRPSHEAPNSA